MSRLSEQLNDAVDAPVGQQHPLLDPLLQQLSIGGTPGQGVLDQRGAPVAAPLAVEREVVEHQREETISMHTRQLGELYVEDRIEERLHRQVERRKGLTPVVGDEQPLDGLA